MHTYLDTLGSMVLGTLLMISLLAFYNNFSTERYMSNLWIISQNNAAVLSEVIDHDFRKIGYNVPSPGNSIISADSSSIDFLLDLDNDGNVDSVRYYVGNSSETPGTDNPNDRLFYRIVNGQNTRGSLLGLTGFKLAYFDSTGAATSVLNDIREIEIFLTVESPVTLDDYYPTVFIRKKVKPKNI